MRDVRRDVVSIVASCFLLGVWYSFVDGYIGLFQVFILNALTHSCYFYEFTETTVDGKENEIVNFVVCMCGGIFASCLLTPLFMIIF